MWPYYQQGRAIVLTFVLSLVGFYLPSPGLAVPFLGSNLDDFAILGGAGVAINGTGSVITGSVGGCCEATAVTGTIPTNFTISGGTVQEGGAIATLAQAELTTAITNLSALGSGATPLAGGLLGGLSLVPGIYSAASAINLTGSLNLAGTGNANDLWVFLAGESLTTASSSAVTVTNAGSGAGVYWVMGAGSATLGSNSTFLGNILANASITLGTNVTLPCGRLLTKVESVTLAGFDTVSTGGCEGVGFANSGGLNLGGSGGSGGNDGGGTDGGGTDGGGTGGGNPVPEPSSALLLATGGMIVRWMKRLG